MIISALLVFILCREIVHQYSMHLLMNKLMSKNFAEYQSTMDRVKVEELKVNKNEQFIADDYDPDPAMAILEGIR